MPVVEHIGRLRYEAGRKNASFIGTHVSFFVLSGEFSFKTPKETFIAKERTLLFLPAGTGYNVKVNRDCDYYYLHFNCSLPVTAGWTQNDNECVKLPSDGNYTSSSDKKNYVYFKQKKVFDGDGETFGKSFYLFLSANRSEKRKAR